MKALSRLRSRRAMRHVPDRRCVALLTCLLTACASVDTLPVAPLPLSSSAATLAPTTPEERERLADAANCAEHRRQFHGFPDAAALATQEQAMARELQAYQELAEESLSLRALAIRLRGELVDKIGRGEALSGADLLRLNQGAAQVLAQRAALIGVARAHECWLDEPLPDDPQRRLIQQKAVAMSLSAALVLYDNYLSTITLYQSHPRLRQHLNQPDKGFGIAQGELDRTATQFASPENRARVRRGLVWFERHGQVRAPETGAGEGNPGDEGYRYLFQLIEQSPSRHMLRKARPTEFLGGMLGLFSTIGADTLVSLAREGMNVTSLLFGNTVGLVEARRGKLDGRPDVLEKLATRVRAGDILLEKTPFRLTDTFIPGHWGHVAIWVGSEEELRALGIWEHPAVRPHQSAIRAGRSVVEALRSGVEMNSLTHFLNIDDLALLRQKELSEAARITVILQALRQVGKAYDFNFDVESTDRIVCSELVYHSYVHMSWPTARMLGRATISPDNVAVRATRNGPLEVVLLYHDGNEVGADQQAAMERFVHAEVAKLDRRQP